MSQQVITIFDKFCKHVDDTIFSMEYKGSVVAFVIDQGYINKFCKDYSVSETSLLYDASRRINSYYASDIRHVKGHLAIQLYAVSKMADSDGLSAKNYRDRLADLLNIETTDLAVWLRENQDDYWKALYKWCDNNDFEIAKSFPNTGLPYGYVQYPIQQAERVLKEQDLKSIACYFVEENLTPDDDLTFRQFWSIISWRKVSIYCTNRGRRIVSNFEYEKDVKKQIFNYFLRWNGEYVQAKQILNVKEDCKQLYLNEDFHTLEIRDDNLELIKSFTLNNLILSKLKEQYRVRRDGVLIFKPDDIYDGVWQETRYLEKGQDGIAVVFNASPYRYHFEEMNLLKRLSYLSIYKVQDTHNMEEYYDEQRNFWLEGGLKIKHNTYIRGAAPTFYYKGNGKYWIDNEVQTSNQINLNFFTEGKHTIKVKNYKAIEINIVEPKNDPNWLLKHNCWQLDRTNGYWRSHFGEGIVGLDFSLYTGTDYKIKEEKTLNSWAKTFCNIKTNSQNAALMTLKNILK